MKEVEEPNEPIDELADAKALFPEIVTPLMAIIEALAGKLDVIAQSVQPLIDKHVTDAQQQADMAHWNEILAAHPDADTMADEADFAPWKESQPDSVKSMLDKGKAPDVVAALNIYRGKHPKPMPTEDAEPMEGAEPVEGAEGAPSLAIDIQPPAVDKIAAARNATPPAIKKDTTRGAGAPKTFTRAQIGAMTTDEYRANSAAIDAAMKAGTIT